MCIVLLDLLMYLTVYIDLFSDIKINLAVNIGEIWMNVTYSNNPQSYCRLFKGNKKSLKKRQGDRQTLVWVSNWINLGYKEWGSLHIIIFLLWHGQE